MKRLFILAITAVAMLASCEKANIQEIIEETQQQEQSYSKKFTFTIKGDFTNPEFCEGGTRANAYMTADGAEMTDLWVVDTKDGEILQQLHQVNTDQDWGSPSMQLTLGTHHVYFLASRGTGAQYQNAVVTWTKAHDTFYTDYEVTVVKTSNGNRAVTLDRVGTKMFLTIEDAIPAGTTSLAFVPSVWFNGWDMMNGQPVAAPAEYNVTFQLPQSYAGATGTSYAIWSLSGADEWTSDITVTSKAGATTNAEVVITDAPFVANRTTKYTGCLYSNSSSSSVSLNAQWLQDYEGVY